MSAYACVVVYCFPAIIYLSAWAFGMFKHSCVSFIFSTIFSLGIFAVPINNKNNVVTVIVYVSMYFIVFLKDFFALKISFYYYLICC